jgi:hypothetical protein
MSGFHAFTVSFADGVGEGITANALRNRLMPMLHHAFKAAPGVFALGLMLEQGGVRVFSQDPHAHQLTDLGSELASRPLVRDYGAITAVAPVVAPSAWVAFRRFRVPTERSDRNADPETGSALRAKRLAEAAQRRLPYVEMASTSNGGRFKLTVSPEKRSEAERGVYAPDGYGLASATRDFALPIDGPSTLFLRRGVSP